MKDDLSPRDADVILRRLRAVSGRVGGLTAGIRELAVKRGARTKATARRLLANHATARPCEVVAACGARRRFRSRAELDAARLRMRSEDRRSFNFWFGAGSRVET